MQALKYWQQDKFNLDIHAASLLSTISDSGRGALTKTMSDGGSVGWILLVLLDLVACQKRGIFLGLLCNLMFFN